MTAVQIKVARSLVVMLAAGGSARAVKDLARTFQIRAAHVRALDVPAEEMRARDRLLQVLR